MQTIILAVEGMTCSGCSNGLEKYLNKQYGIINASVNLVLANVTIDYDDKILNQEKLETYIKQAGFKSLGIFKEINLGKRTKLDTFKFFLSTVLAIILIYFSMGDMVGLPMPNMINRMTNPQIYSIALLGITLLFFVYGFDILKNGIKNLIHKIPNMDTLVTLGVLSSFLYSIYGMYMIFTGHIDYVMNLYFESSAIVLYFIKLGRYLDGMSKDKTKYAIKKLVEITPNYATIEINGQEKRVTLDEIKKGMIVIAKPGEKIAVDGEIIEGKAHLDEAFITGESMPVKKQEGEKVIAGSLNFDGYIKYKAEKIGKDSTVSEIVRLVINASNTKSPVTKIADKISGFFVPTIIVIAVITFIVYLVIGQGFAEALKTFITILVVSCPCSLGLATPLAMIISEGVCAENGILVKKSEILETASKVDTVVFDKTGTLTYGKLKISKIFNYTNMSEKELLELAGSLESKSTHPISKAFVEYMNELNGDLIYIDDFEEQAGFGISGRINNRRRTFEENSELSIRVVLGNSKILAKHNILNNHYEDERILRENGSSIIYMAINREIVALFGVNDVVRESSANVVEQLNERKIDTVMLTGDNEVAAFKIANQLGMKKVISDVMPNEKTDIIKKLKKGNKIVMMCGDGINDSPALANSDIGVSIKSGTDIAMDSANVILMKNDLGLVLRLINISKKTVRNIKQNLFWAFFYNLLMIPVAMGVFKRFGIELNPMLGSIAMVCSSLTVILNSLRLKRIK